jgi:tetratricopeptide (TPR) repeat protein
VNRADVMMPLNAVDPRPWQDIGDGWMQRNEAANAFIVYCVATTIAHDQRQYGLVKDLASRAAAAYSLAPNDERLDAHRTFFGLPAQYLGWAWQKENNFRDARRSFDEQIKLGWKVAVGYLDRGWCSENLGDLESAEADYLKAVDSDPQYGAAYRNLGHLCRRQGRLAEALLHFDSAVKLEVKNAHNFRWLGTCYLNAGFPALAIMYYETAMSMEPALSSEMRPFVDIARRTLLVMNPQSEYRFAFTKYTGNPQDLAYRGGFLFVKPEHGTKFWEEGRKDSFYDEGSGEIRKQGHDFEDRAKSKVFSERAIYEVVRRQPGWVNIRRGYVSGWLTEDRVLYDTLGELTESERKVVDEELRRR